MPSARASNTATVDAVQVARNNAIVREANERIDRAGARLNARDPLPSSCECADPECRALLSRTVRSDTTVFIVRPGHEATDVDTVVEDHGDYRVVRKHEGVPADIARRTDDLT